MFLSIICLNLIFSAYDYGADVEAAALFDLPSSFRDSVVNLYHHTSPNQRHSLGLTEESWASHFHLAGLPCLYTSLSNEQPFKLLLCYIGHLFYTYDSDTKKSTNTPFDQPETENHPHVPETLPATFSSSNLLELISDNRVKISSYDMVTEAPNSKNTKSILLQIKEICNEGYLPALQFLNDMKRPRYLQFNNAHYLTKQIQMVKAIEKKSYVEALSALECSDLSNKNIDALLDLFQRLIYKDFSNKENKWSTLIEDYNRSILETLKKDDSLHWRIGAAVCSGSVFVGTCYLGLGDWCHTGICSIIFKGYVNALMVGTGVAAGNFFFRDLLTCYSTDLKDDNKIEATAYERTAKFLSVYSVINDIISDRPLYKKEILSKIKTAKKKLNKDKTEYSTIEKIIFNP